MSKKELVKQIVDKFLGWKLPANFNPDAGITFKAEYNKAYTDRIGKPPMRHEPIGTNLFDADQASAMVEYCAGDVIDELQAEIERLGRKLAEQQAAPEWISVADRLSASPPSLSPESDTEQARRKV